MNFMKNLSNRGYSGKLTFNTEKGRLDIKVSFNCLAMPSADGSLQVQTDEAANSQKKDAKTLSGGKTNNFLVELSKCETSYRREEFLDHLAIAHAMGCYRVPCPRSCTCAPL